MNKAYLILFFLWACYCFLHSLLASNWLKDAAYKVLGNFFKFYRVVYSIIATVFLLVVLIYQFSIKEFYLFQSGIFIKVIAIVAAATGILVMAVCSRKYFGFITGFKNNQIKNKTDELYTSGINNIVRHPLYAGTIIFIWSLFVLFPFISNLIFCTIITVYIFIGIKLEERKLSLKYGNIYQQYSSAVPMIIPNLLKKYKANYE